MAERLSLTGPGSVIVGRLVPGGWQTYRAIRLAMLQDSPAAFGTTFEQVARNEEQYWRQLLTDSVVLVAMVGGVPAGSVRYPTTQANNPGDCVLLGMWVVPRFRSAGVGRALVDAVVEQARAAGKERVVLRVVAGNAPATDLYLRAGFAATGRTFPHPHGDQVVQVEMELILAGDHPLLGEVR